MATSTFERKIVIKDSESLKKLAVLMSDKTPVKPISVKPYTFADEERSKLLLKQCLSRSKY